MCSIVYLDIYILLNHSLFSMFFFLAGPKRDTACMLKPTRTCSSQKIFAFQRTICLKEQFYILLIWSDETLKTWHWWNGNTFAMYEKPKRKGKKYLYCTLQIKVFIKPVEYTKCHFCTRNWFFILVKSKIKSISQSKVRNCSSLFFSFNNKFK